MSEHQNKSGVLDLSRLALEPGGGRRLEIELRPSVIELGGQGYTPTVGSGATLDVSRTSGGWALRLRFAATLEGACVRCLELAQMPLEIDAREVEHPGAEDEELHSPYVSDVAEVDLERWADDALVLAMPHQLLCREDCAGLCAVCGVSLNDADPAAHEHGGSRDPRWAKLDQLKGGPAAS